MKPNRQGKSVVMVKLTLYMLPGWGNAERQIEGSGKKKCFTLSYLPTQEDSLFEPVINL
jgi:hypothetical protein